MIHYSTLKDIKDYRDNPAVSQSYLKELLSGKKFDGRQSLPALFGSYFDMMITMPDALDEVYVVSDVKRPSETICDLVNGFMNYLLYEDMLVSPNLNDHQEGLFEWMPTTDYYTNRKLESRIIEFIKNGTDWWRTKVELGEKEIITSAEKALVEQTYTRLYTNSELRWIFDDSRQDIYYQYPFYWTEDEINCKGLADIVLKKDFSQCEIDIKYTTAPNIETWFNIAMTLGYPIQKAFYKSGLELGKVFPVEQTYWLVCSPYWAKLVPVSSEILSLGKDGAKLKKGIFYGETTHQIIKEFRGYKEGLRLYKELNLEKKEETILTPERVEELFLKNIY